MGDEGYVILILPYKQKTQGTYSRLLQLGN